MAYTDNIIPAMTSDTAPSGVASSSDDLSADYAAWKAFDHLNADVLCWQSSGLATPKCLQYQFAVAKTITQYAILSRNGTAYVRPPKSWTFCSSNDGASWTTLDTQTNVTDWETLQNTKKIFPFPNTTAYLYYRLAISALNDASYVAVGELEMMETAGGGEEPPPGGIYVPRSIGSGIGSGIASGIA